MMGILGVASTALLIFAGGYNATKWLVKVDSKIEDRRRGAAKLAGVLSKFGLTRIPEFLLDYNVGDYGGMGDKILDLAKLFLKGDDAVVEEFDKVFENCLVAKLKTEAGRAYVSLKLGDAQGVVYGPPS